MTFSYKILPKVMVWWSHANCITHSYNSTQLYILYTEYFFHSPVNALMSSEKRSFIYHLSIDASALNHHETDKANLPSQMAQKSRKWTNYLFDCRNTQFVILTTYTKYFIFLYIFSLWWTSVLYRCWGQDNRHVQWIGRFQDLLRQI